MRILLLHQYFLEKGEGGGTRFNEMTKNWSKMGHQVSVIAGMVHYSTGIKQERYKGKYLFKDSNFYENVDVYRTFVSDKHNLNFLGRLWAYFSFMFSSLYVGLFKIKGDFDVILVTSPPLFVGLSGLIISKIKRIPLVFEVRDLWPESAIDTGVLNNSLLIKMSYALEKMLYRNAKLINVLTPAFKEKLTKNKGVSDKKIIFIPNAADFDMAEKLDGSFNRIDFKKGLDLENNFVITYVGAHGLANDLIQVINAAERLGDTNVVFQLIGDGMQKSTLINEVKKRNINNVIFRDPVSKEEVFKYLLASDAGISVLKKVDTFKTIYSNKTFDYMASKLPILLAIDGVSRDLIEDSKSGIYIEPENIDSFVDGVQYLLNMPKDELKIMGENGYKYAKTHFDRLKLSKDYIVEINGIT